MLIASVTVLMAAGCDAISIAPSCPTTLGVGESATVQANERNAGAIGTFRWEVVPAGAGVFGNATAATTTFQALEPGGAVLLLTASDGLFQTVAACGVEIGGPATTVAVAFQVTPAAPIVGEIVALICDSVGATEATTFVITQIQGATVQISPPVNGGSLFTAGAVGELQFQCVGESAAGQRSAAQTVTVTVVADIPPDTGGGRRGLP